METSSSCDPSGSSRKYFNSRMRDQTILGRGNQHPIFPPGHAPSQWERATKRNKLRNADRKNPPRAFWMPDVSCESARKFSLGDFPGSVSNKVMSSISFGATYPERVPPLPGKSLPGVTLVFLRSAVFFSLMRNLPV